MRIWIAGLLTSSGTPLSLTSSPATLNGFASTTMPSVSELSGSVLGSPAVSRELGNTDFCNNSVYYNCKKEVTNWKKKNETFTRYLL